MRSRAAAIKATGLSYEVMDDLQTSKRVFRPQQITASGACSGHEAVRRVGEHGDAAERIQRGETDTHQLATLLNCSRRFLGRKVMMVYLEVMTWLVA